MSEMMNETGVSPEAAEEADFQNTFQEKYSVSPDDWSKLLRSIQEKNRNTDHWSTTEHHN